MGRISPLVLLLFACALGGCHRDRPRPRLVEIRFVEPPATTFDAIAVQLDEQAARQHVAELLEATPGDAHLDVALGSPPRPSVDWRLTYTLRASIEPSDTPRQHRTLRGYVAARLEQVADPSAAAPSEAPPETPPETPIEFQAVAERELPDGAQPDPALVHAHLQRALDDVTRALPPLYAVHRERPAALGASLRDPRLDEAVRFEAIHVAAERRLRVAVPALIDLLGSDDDRLRDRALGALVAIGDRRAVKPVTRFARFDDTANLPKAIDALGSLGGDEARAYLEFVVSSGDEDMRELARDALRRLDARRADSTAR